MPIPRIVHQLWKDESIPKRWEQTSRSIKKYHQGWEYRLWTDDAMTRHVKVNHPDFYPFFAAMRHHIMRVDVFRYVLMHDFGGMYCDLDYEFLRPYDYGEHEVVLSLEYDQAYGDEVNQVANYVFASSPRHALWKDVIAELMAERPAVAVGAEVCEVTGPGLLTRVFFANRERYADVALTPQPVLSPRRVHGRYERKFYINSGITFGFHHGWGSWRTRLSASYVKKKIRKYVELVGRLTWLDRREPRSPVR